MTGEVIGPNVERTCMVLSDGCFVPVKTLPKHLFCAQRLPLLTAATADESPEYKGILLWQCSLYLSHGWISVVTHSKALE